VRFTDDEGTQVQRTTANTSGVLPGANIALPHPDRALSGNYNAHVHPESGPQQHDRLELRQHLVGGDYAGGHQQVELGLGGLPTIYPVTDDLLPQVTIPTYAAANAASWAFNRVRRTPIAQ